MKKYDAKTRTSVNLPSSQLTQKCQYILGFIQLFFSQSSAFQSAQMLMTFVQFNRLKSIVDVGGILPLPFFTLLFFFCFVYVQWRNFGRGLRVE